MQADREQTHVFVLSHFAPSTPSTLKKIAADRLLARLAVMGILLLSRETWNLLLVFSLGPLMMAWM